MRPLSELYRNLRTALEDRHLTDSEWESLVEPIADSTGLSATEISRKVLEVWSDDRYQIDPQTRDWMRAFLDSRGYDVPDARPTGISTHTLEEELEATNVGERDDAFDAMAKKVGASAAHVDVAVIDNGFDLWHPELGHKGWSNPGEIPGNGIDDDHDGKVDDSNGWDFVDWNNDCGNPNGDWHGTHVAGIATRGTDQISVIPCRMLGGSSPWSVQQLSDAVDYACGNGAKVINMSFGIDTPERVQMMRDLVARHPDTLFVLACGNDNRPLGSYDPNSFFVAGSYPNVAVVAASDATGAKAGFSNYGPQAMLAARGTDVLSTIPGAQYGKISGTSMAAPEVVNAAAKCLLLDPALTPVSVQKLLAVTSDVRADWSGQVAAGGPINPERAYALAALTHLVRGGATVEAGADQLKLHGSERTRLIATAAQVLAA